MMFDKINIMKIKSLILCVASTFFYCCLTQAQDISFEPTHDAYVSKSSAGSNYGGEDKLLVKGSTNGNFDRNTYLKFNVTGGTTNYEQILIKLTKNGGEELDEINVHSTATGWSENTITLSNAPDFIAEVGQGLLKTGDDVYIDVTNFVKSRINENQFTISVALNTTEIIGSPFSAASKESVTVDDRPQLIFYKTTQFNSIKGMELSNYMSSNMVIQRGHPFPFRGTGPAGETITIDFVREGIKTTNSGIVDPHGDFSIFLPAQLATANGCTATLSIVGFTENTIVLDNILIGDVWFAGGQSNMEKKVDYVLNAQDLITDADNFLSVRAFRAEYNALFEPTDQVKQNNASWIVCSSDKVDRVSAVAYMYAKRIYQETGIPIGLMQAYVGGTEIETWISEEKIKDDLKLQFVEDRLPSYDANDPKYYQDFPSVNYNGMVNPLRFYPIKGFLFYQGESNVKRAPEYGVLLKSLIQDYRAKWNLGNLPFYYVQLFNIGIASDRNYETKPDNNTWQMLRQQQYLVLENSGLENIAMPVIIETNEERNNPDNNIRIHPRNKQPVGERLALIALKNEYGKDVSAFSPFVEASSVVENTVYIRMKNVGDGLKLRDDATTLTGFAISGSDGTFYEATATIVEPNLLSVISLDVAAPVEVAYGWSRDPLCTLDNSANLPASPFKIDLRPSKSYGAVEDSYIGDGSQATVNFGSSQELKVATGTTDNLSYIKFDSSDLLFVDFESAQLQLFATTVTSATDVKLFETNNLWREGTINSTNAPVIGQEINSATISASNISYTWDITQALKTAISNESLFISLVLKNMVGSLISFASKENTANAPQLVLKKKRTTLSTVLLDQTDVNFIVFPNPVTAGKINIRFKQFDDSAVSKITMFNLLGQEFLIADAYDQDKNQLDVSAIASGAYILRVTSKNGKSHRKIIIQ